MQTPSTDPVARYYDSNTMRFLMVGGGGATHSIHRQLWGTDVDTARGAADYINRLIAEQIAEIGAGPEVSVLDMGCGVGGTLFRLADSFPRSHLHGITISPKQCDIANRLATKRGIHHRCRIHLGDFRSAQLDVVADAIVAVESFVHAGSPERFFSWATDHLHSDGHLLLADDFLSSDLGPLEERQRRHVADFQAGWQVPALTTVDECVGAAAELGLELVSDADLTSLIRLGRPRDLAIALLRPVLNRLGLARIPFFGNIIGGSALQAGLREGLFTYRFLIFRRPEAAAT